MLGPFVTQTNESVQVMEDIDAKMGKTVDSSFVPQRREMFRGISKPENDELRRNGGKHTKANFARITKY
jgi:hypothetical protein